MKKLFLFFFLTASFSFAQESIKVNDIQEFNSAVVNAKPGTTIVLANGVWKNTELLLEGNGTPEAP